MHAAPSSPIKGLPLIAALAALFGFLALQYVAYRIAGGFEYPLDDPYIHLAMASGIAQGTYGVNAGEAASAASSILYPLLLAPFAGGAFGQIAPLWINAVMVVAAGALWGGVLAAAGFRGIWAFAAAALGPIALNMPTVAFTGLEHSAHLVVTLLVVLGVARFVFEGRVAWWFGAAIVLAPLLRLEGLALSGIALIVLIWRGRAWLGMGLAGLLAAILIGFMAFLTAQGLPALPGSVMAKMDMGAGQAQGLMRLAAQMQANLAHRGGIFLATLIGVALVMPIYAKRLRVGGRDVMLRGLALAGLAHLVLGQIGWMDRYEHYIIVALIAGLALSMAGLGRGDHRRMASVLTIALAVSAITYLPHLRDTIYAPRGLHLQQAQMARLARQIAAPVAVNDLGRVVWGNPNYVLDVMGLGSAEALAARRAKAPDDPAWLAPLLAKHGIVLAMVYDNWFGAEMAATGWVRIGTLGQDPVHLGALGSVEVAFYAPQDHAADMTRAVTQWANALPEGALFKLGQRDGSGAVLKGKRYSAT